MPGFTHSGKEKKGKCKSNSTAATVHLAKHRGQRAPPAHSVLWLHPCALNHLCHRFIFPERWGYGASSSDLPEVTEWRKVPGARVQCPLRSGRVHREMCWLFVHLLSACMGSGGLQGILLGVVGLVQCYGFEPAKLVSAFFRPCKRLMQRSWPDCQRQRRNLLLQRKTPVILTGLRLQECCFALSPLCFFSFLVCSQ